MRTTGREGEEEEEEEEDHHYHHHHYHKKKKKPNKKSNQRREARICKALCCSSSSSSNTRFSISTSSSSSSDDSSQRHSRLSYRHGSFSSLTHYMVQEKLEQMINEREEAKHQENIKKRTRRTRSEGGSTTKFIVMMAMEKCSYDPREDFRDSIIEMILVNRIHGAEELRSLLEHYLLMNPHEYKSIILEIFHEVCTDLFLSSKGHFV